jgi:serine/threonine protein kinase
MPYLGSSTLADVLEEVHRGDQPVVRGSQILDALSKHEHVVGFCEQCRRESPPTAALKGGRYVDAVVEMGIQLADALVYTSDRGILHRDIKPANILLTPSGRPMLLDFCLSLDDNTEAPNMRRGGTLPYSSPEQIQDSFLGTGDGSRFDPRSDVYSLGIILYECLTGVVPFGPPVGSADIKKSARQLLEAQTAPIKAIHEINGEVSSRLADTVQSCLAAEMDDRMSSPAELANQLRRHFSRPARLRRWVWKRRFGAGVMGLAGVLIVAFAVAFVATRSSPGQRYMTRAMQSLESGRPEDAVRYLNSALLWDPRKSNARLARGLAHLELKDLRRTK